MHLTTIYEMSVGEHNRRLDDRHRDHLAALRRRERDAEPTPAREPEQGADQPHP